MSEPGGPGLPYGGPGPLCLPGVPPLSVRAFRRERERSRNAPRRRRADGAFRDRSRTLLTPEPSLALMATTATPNDGPAAPVWALFLPRKRIVQWRRVAQRRGHGSW